MAGFRRESAVIMGVDHVALSCGDIREAAAALGREGYEVKFVDEGLKNDPAKRPYLRCYQPVHSIAYCRAQGAPSIELTSHGTPPDGPGTAYRVRLAARPADAAPGDAKYGQAVWKPFAAPLDYDEGEGRAFVRSVTFRAADAQASAEFWKTALGFRDAAEPGDGEVALQFRAPMPNWSLRLSITAGEEQGKSYLDDAGFPCVALLSSDPARDLERCVARGGSEPAGPFELKVGGQLLRVALIRGPAGEIVELIGLVKGTS